MGSILSVVALYETLMSLLSKLIIKRKDQAYGHEPTQFQIQWNILQRVSSLISIMEIVESKMLGHLVATEM